MTMSMIKYKCGLIPIIFFTIVFLKLLGVINWPWIIILIPLWLPFAITIIIAISSLLMVLAIIIITLIMPGR